jgi:hypothetical protein
LRLWSRDLESSPVIGRVVSPRLPAVKQRTLGSKLALHAHGRLLGGDHQLTRARQLARRRAAHVDGEEVDRVCKEVIRYARDAPTERDTGQLWGIGRVSCCDAKWTGERRTYERSED